MGAMRQKQIRPFLRVLAAGWLFVWLAALAACSAESLCGHAHDGGADEDSAQHVAAGHHDDSSDSSPHGCADNPFCQSLKSAGLSQPLAHLDKPDFQTLAFLPAQPLDVALQTALQPVISRQPPDRILVFTPEVYLGPAFRSHAPPVSTLA